MNAWSVWDIFRITRAVINGKAGCDLPRKEPQGSLRLNENTGRTYRSNHFSFSNENKCPSRLKRDDRLFRLISFIISYNENYIQHSIPFCLTKSYKSRIFCSNLCVDLGKLPLSFENKIQSSQFRVQNINEIVKEHFNDIKEFWEKKNYARNDYAKLRQSSKGFMRFFFGKRLYDWSL